MSIKRIRVLAEELRKAVLEGQGFVSPTVRLGAASRAAAAGGYEIVGGGAVSADVAAYADTVARHAYRVTDEQVASLLAAGHSEDAIFELTVSAAVGAGLARLERGLAALEGANDATETP